MKVKLKGEVVEATPYGLIYPNDMLNGVFLDMEDDYAFLSANVPEHQELIEQIDEDYELYDMSDYDVDYDQAPHKWVVKSVGRMVVHTAEQVCQEACE